MVRVQVLARVLVLTLSVSIMDDVFKISFIFELFSIAFVTEFNNKPSVKLSIVILFIP